MRTLALLVATTLLATNSGAQTPLTIDTTFNFYYTPELMDYWEANYAGGAGMWQPRVGGLVWRTDGNIMVTGDQLLDLGEVPWGGERSLIIEPSGSGSITEQLSTCGPQVIEMPAANQYFSPNRRRNYDCSSDVSFGQANFYFNERNPESWQIFEDRSALVAGYFRITENDPLRYVLVKVDQWGEWDSTYTPRSATGPDVWGEELFPLVSGQYLFSGNWSTYEGRPCTSVIRIEADGTQDTTFAFRSSRSTLAAVHEQPDGKVILAGQFLMLDYPDTLNLLRLNADGSLDPTFNNFNHVVTATDSFSTARFAGINVLEPLDEGRFVIGGKFTRIDNAHRGCIACVDTAGNLLDCWANGGLVPVFNSPGGYPYVGLSGFKRLVNGETYLFGQYQGFIDANGLHPRQCLLSRVNMTGVGLANERVVAPALRLWPNPGSTELRLEWPVPGTYRVTLRDAQGRAALSQVLTSSTQVLDTAPLASGFYTVEATTANGSRATAKWSKP